MRRGFLNRMKANDDNGPPAAEAPPRVFQGDGVTTSRPTKLSEPRSSMAVEDIAAHLCSVEPYEVVRIPPPKSTKSKDPSSICIIRGSTCATIINTPGFCRALPPLNPADVVFTKNTPSAGVGLFAQCNVKVHQVVFSERPLLVLPQGYLFNLQNPSKVQEEAVKKYELAFEAQLQQALSDMTKEELDAYTSLSSCFPDRPPLYGIGLTNAFGTGIEEEGLERKDKCGAVGRLASRINHCCAPNIEVVFDISTFSLQIIALRDIKAGEQFFRSYCPFDLPFNERRKQLAIRYGFLCKCQACVNATPESDRLRAEREDRLLKIIDERERMFSNPRFSIRSLDPLLKLEKDIVKEGLDFGQNFVDLLFIIFQAYHKLNDIVKGGEYSNKVNKYRGQKV